jgi:hypothetical protein
VRRERVAERLNAFETGLEAFAIADPPAEARQGSGNLSAGEPGQDQVSVKRIVSVSSAPLDSRLPSTPVVCHVQP